MQIRYSDHIKNRLDLRRIEYDLPKRVFEEAKEMYFDRETGHLIAVMKIDLLSEGQKQNRINRGRWRKI